jgi:hypothetical protein
MEEIWDMCLQKNKVKKSNYGTRASTFGSLSRHKYLVEMKKSLRIGPHKICPNLVFAASDEKITVTLAEPIHSTAVMTRHAAREQMIHTGQANLQAAHEAQQTILELAVIAATNLEAPMKLAILNNAIAEGAFSTE